MKTNGKVKNRLIPPRAKKITSAGEKGEMSENQGFAQE
jgi:hypothetical protein